MANHYLPYIVACIDVRVKLVISVGRDLFCYDRYTKTRQVRK